MNLFMLLLAFFGSWLLFAGPIFQAATELKEQDFERERLREVSLKVTISKNVSAWWWLLPPVKLVLEYIQTKKWRQEHFKLLEPEDRDALINFTNKANGWLLVAFGALLMLIEAIFQIGSKFGWPWWMVVIIIVFCIFVSLLYTILRLLRTNKLIEGS